MELIRKSFEDRVAEIDAYIKLLESIEKHLSRSGPPKIGGLTVSVQQQKILYSTTYLQLYNLVEATVTWCVVEVCDASSRDSRWKPGELTDRLRREWVKHKAATHSDRNVENRLDLAVELCDIVIAGLPLSKWTLERGGGGNWDEKEIDNVTDKLGFKLAISSAARKGIKRQVRNEMGALVLVRDLRNRLAHGTISFAECGDGVTASDLRELTNRTVAYLREVLNGFARYIDGHEFLIPSVRPPVGAVR